MYEDYIINALETVITWDLPEEDIHKTILDQACLLSGGTPELSNSNFLY